MLLEFASFFPPESSAYRMEVTPSTTGKAEV